MHLSFDRLSQCQVTSNTGCKAGGPGEGRASARSQQSRSLRVRVVAIRCWTSRAQCGVGQHQGANGRKRVSGGRCFRNQAPCQEPGDISVPYHTFAPAAMHTRSPQGVICNGWTVLAPCPVLLRSLQFCCGLRPTLRAKTRRTLLQTQRDEAGRESPHGGILRLRLRGSCFGRLLRQPRFSQALFVSREVFRSATQK